ncbi:type VII secretion protein [Streptomyces sp. NPDC096012]|uniref:nucleotide-binding protein n=1 Tax=Streptomyces sp. NPDC096012 TaxID=3155684 RepID=UPI00336AA393
MTTSGRWQDDVLRELTAGSADEAREQPAPGDTRQALPVRHLDGERPNPGRPSREQHTTDPVSPVDEPQSAPHTPAQAPPRLANEIPPSQVPGTGSSAPGVEAASQTPATPPNAFPSVRPPRQARLPMATPEPVPTLDPRLAIALGSPQHGDSLVRRSGRSLRKLTSSAAQEVAVESRLGTMVQQPVTTGRVIAVTSIRGGVGKTTTAALLSRAFSHYRHDPVLALEADAALGTLPVRMGAQSVRWSCVELSRILTPSMRLTDVTGYLVPVADGGWLLPASQGRVGAPLDVATYRTVTLALRRYFAVTVVDCETLPGEVARTAMDTAHARVVVAPLTAEGVGGTRIVLDWLGGLPHAALASTVVALTSNTPDANLDLKAATAHLRETGVTLVHLPYDRHLAGGGPITPDRLGEAARRAATQLAAEALQRAVRVR